MIGDHDGDGVPDLSVRFNQNLVLDTLSPDRDVIVVAGEFLDGTTFEGYGTMAAPASPTGFRPAPQAKPTLKTVPPAETRGRAKPVKR